MDKRFIFFLIASLLVIQVTTMYMEKTAPPREAIETAATQATPPTSTDGATTATASRPAATPEAARISPDAFSRSVEPAEPREPLRTEPIQTASSEIVFSRYGGVPITWDIVDERFVVPQPGETAASPDTPGREHLIDPRLEDHPLMPRPFELIMKEKSGRFLNQFNTMSYEAERIEANGRTGMRFTSPVDETGLQVVKTYLFDYEGFMGSLAIELRNAGGFNLALSDMTPDGTPVGPGLLLGPGLGQPEPVGALMGRWAKTDVVIKRGETFDYKHIDELQDFEYYTGRAMDWGGVQNLYFMTALIPKNATQLFTAKALVDRDTMRLAGDEKLIQHYPVLELYGEPLDLRPGDSRTYEFSFFAGPKKRGVLKQAGEELERVMFYNSWSWMRALCLVLLAMLNWFHALVGNWGVAIMLLTIVVRLITFPLVHKGMKAQAKMTAQQAKLKPMMDKINEKFKSDPQRKQQEIFKLYKEHGVNPLGMFKGCAWMMVQIPIFFALYKLLYTSIDLRGAPFLWVDDLSHPDQFAMIGSFAFNLLPIITALTQMLASKFTMSMAATDPQQAQMQKMMMYMMPAVILVFTYSFPAGLMLYWLVSNTWQVVQQIWVNKTIRKPEAAKA